MKSSLRDDMRRPTQPGAVLREDILPALGMNQTELAQRLGVSRLSVNELLHEKRALSADMAGRLARLLGNSAEIWLNLQKAVDVWELEQSPERFAAIEPLPVGKSEHGKAG